MPYAREPSPDEQQNSSEKSCSSGENEMKREKKRKSVRQVF
jgi:hypothetical protein